MSLQKSNLNNSGDIDFLFNLYETSEAKQDFLEAQDLALELLQEFGREVTIRRQERAFNPVTGAISGTTEQTGRIFIVTPPASKGTIEAFDNRLDEKLLANKQLRFVIASAKGLSFEPKSQDLLVFDTKTWLVLGCTPINIDGTPIIYKMGVQLN